jgi:peptidoglycan L-alanyl-D-glutamate endopeptidase CwlK
MPKFSQKSLDKLKGVHPDLVKVITEAIKDSPIDFTIFSGVRSLQEQKDLYALGRTKVNPDGKSKSKPFGNIVTKADGVKNKSNHQVKSDGLGHAIDFVPYVNGALDWNNESNFINIANHIKEVAKNLNVNIGYGGDWKFRDLPHFELK